jgi:hypothetical protein
MAWMVSWKRNLKLPLVVNVLNFFDMCDKSERYFQGGKYEEIVTGSNHPLSPLISSDAV